VHTVLTAILAELELVSCLCDFLVLLVPKKNFDDITGAGFLQAGFFYLVLVVYVHVRPCSCMLVLLLILMFNKMYVYVMLAQFRVFLLTL